jgi:putative membrane protein
MYVRWIVAALHLLALGIGLGAIWWRGLSLRGELNLENIKRVLYADSLWGIAALLWISTGLARAFAGLEKGSAYYLQNNAFWIKMGLLVLILMLEVLPMSNFMKWRFRLGRGEQVEIDPGRKRLFSNISFVQSGLVVLMVLAATAMARGLGV